MFGLAPLLLVFPFAGFLINGIFGRKIVASDPHAGERTAGWLSTGMALAAFAVTVALFFAVQGDSHGHTVMLADWFRMSGFYVPWAMQIDGLSVAMLFVVTGVGSLIHIYAIGYMHGDRDFARFFAYLNLFLFFMIILVTGNNYLMLFVGWEGVGLCSFLLIGFWFSKDRKINGVYEGVINSNAARKAFVANRVGDLAMILAMILTWWSFRSLVFDDVFTSALGLFNSGQMVQLPVGEFSVGAVLTAITALFLVGAAGKSAQIPLFVWLPDAMAGPTPVSALIHAATMVTSGIYLMVRSNVLFEIVRASDVTLIGSLTSPDLVAIIGAITALYAGLIAFTQFDIKKVLAYSTVSQLGFMVAAVGMGAYVPAMFHLITHAFFKALLFMSSGSVIHGMEHGHHHVHDHHHKGSHGHHPAEDHHADFDPQDMRTMGGLRTQMPQTFVVFMIGALALAGIFPFAGFWSKDEILAHAAKNSGGVFTFVYWMLTLAAVCTAFYMGRQIKMTFFGKPRHAAAAHAHESPPVMIRPLQILAGLSAVGGLLNLPYFVEKAKTALAKPATLLAKPAAAEEGGSTIYHWLEHWLEHSIASLELTSQKVLQMPKTPPSLQYDVAIISTLLAVGALALAFFVVYRNTPQKATDPDPIFRIPIFPFLQKLPLDSFYMKGVIPAFNRMADWTAHRLDWDFWHDWFHNRVIRDSFVRTSRFVADRVDAGVVDGGMVAGIGRFITGLADLFRQMQTGYVRNYALGLFLGVVALLVWFIFLA
jgi:NADH-quinone oxidoreductase subunit L